MQTLSGFVAKSENHNFRFRYICSANCGAKFIILLNPFPFQTDDLNIYLLNSYPVFFNRKQFLSDATKASLGMLLLSNSSFKLFGREENGCSYQEIPAGEMSLLDSLHDYIIIENYDKQNAIIYGYDIRLDPSIIPSKNKFLLLLRSLA